MKIENIFNYAVIVTRLLIENCIFSENMITMKAVNFFKHLPIVLIAGIILGSCASSNDVVSGKLISKRKYNDGFHISLNHKNKGKQTKEENNDILVKRHDKVNEEVIKVNRESISEAESAIESNELASSGTDTRQVRTVGTKSSLSPRFTNRIAKQNKKESDELVTTQAITNTSKKSEVKSAAHAIKEVAKKKQAAKNSGQGSLVNLILIILLIILVLSLLSLVEGTLGGLLSLILAIIIIVLILRYFGII